ncbi:glycoside hydrolase family 3 N-terminal domain-containing protein [Egbenema bharatensis]|uniref:glycoside hydrolase family 3 N-terminal domain-containing protein n=1 Tax=Egbenema bharatensis TaxID=3463334 RepID=UPI003A86E099
MEGLPEWRQLPLAEQVAQMIVVRASGHLFDQQIEYPQWEPPSRVLQRWVQELGVGGVLLLGGSAAEVGLRTQQLQEWAIVPLLICADIEEGVGQRFAGATWFPPPMALGAISRADPAQAEAYAEQMGATIAQESLAIGINWLLAPVVDVNNNPLNPVINVRALGETPQQVSQLATAFLRGTNPYPVLTTAKHFPGHGDTAIDSHLELPVIPHSELRLQAVEFPPFEAAMAAGVDAVMTAHLQIPLLDTEHPATLSAAIVSNLLRKDLAFEGLIVTDALVMGAITQRYGANEAPVLAIEAGADIVLMPVDPEGAIQAICQAVETGRITLEQIHASLERIWYAKQKVCSVTPTGNTPHAWEQIPPPALEFKSLTTQLAQPESIATATKILQAAMRVYQPVVGSRLRATAAMPCRNLVVVDDMLNSPFLEKHSPAIVLPRKLGYALQWVDRHTGGTPGDSGAVAPQPTLLQLFIRGNPFRGSGLTQTAHDWLRYLIETAQLQALVLYGSPYLLEAWLSELPTDVPYVFTYGQMDAAQQLALDALFHPTADLIATVGDDRRFTD